MKYFKHILKLIKQKNPFSGNGRKCRPFFDFLQQKRELTPLIKRHIKLISDIKKIFGKNCNKVEENGKLLLCLHP